MTEHIIKYEGVSIATQTAISMWADATTDASSERRRDLLRDKTVILNRFFNYVKIHPVYVKSSHVKDWQAELEHKELAHTTVYAMISRVSSFYNWLMKDPDLASKIRVNPVDLMRPRAPKPYQSEDTKSLMDDEVETLLDYVKSKADDGDVVGKRDYALLYLYFVTGLRRSEVINLCWRDFQIADTLVLHVRTKGGEYESREVEDMQAAEFVFDYLEASGRLGTIQEDNPLWTSHDRANVNPGGHLTSHAFVKNLKRYAREAGLGKIHLHQMRHTFGRIVAEETGSMVEVQNALGHKHRKTTEVYVNRIALKRDKYSQLVAKRLGLIK